jgi:hypothetical protein
MSAVEALPAIGARNRFFDALAPGGRRALFVLGIIGVSTLFAFPVLWLVLTSLRPGYAVYYVHRGTDFTLDNFQEVLSQEIVLRALWNSFAISTLATVLSLGGNLRIPLRALRVLGAAPLLCHPGAGHLRHLLGSAAAARGRPHLLLFLDHEGLFRRH